jgi:rod shape determining protein RodA
MLFGINTNGSQRWLALPGFRFQPSEIMKIAMILCMARYCSKNPPGPNGYSLGSLLMPALIIGIPFSLILKQPDLGTGLTVLIIGSSIVLFAGINLKTLMYLILAAVASFIPAWLWIFKHYQKQRILTMLNPDADPFGTGYHIIQSKIAVGSGSFLGKGYLQGTQSQLEFLPEHTTDFIFSVLAEEWGFVGSAIVVLLYFALTQRMLSVAQRSRDNFSMLFVVGASVMLFFHVMVNIGMVLGMMPVVGIPLPLFSYGGTAAMTNFLIFGIVLGVGMRRFMFKGYERLPAIIIIFSTLFIGNIGKAIAEEESKASQTTAKHFNFELDPRYYENLIQSINTQSVFYHPDKKTETEANFSGEPWHEWLRNEIYASFSMDDIQLTFEATDLIGKIPKGTNIETTIRFEDSDFLLKQDQLIRAYTEVDLTQNQRFLNLQIDSGGKTRRIIGNNIESQLHLYIPHNKDIGFVLFLPKAPKIKGAQREINSRGVVMCPRLIAPQHIKSNLPTLIDLPLALKATGGVVTGAVRGKVNTGFGQGLAEAEILTTPQIQPSKIVKDLSTNLFPYVQLKYVPIDTKIKTLAFDKQTTLGIRTRLVLQNSLNHLAESKMELGVGIKEFELTDPKPIKIKKKQYIVDQGTCYAIVFAINPWHIFKKELLAHSKDSKKELEEMVEAFGSK